MNDETAKLKEEELASWLAACDEQLAMGLPASSTQCSALTPEDQSRLERDLDCLRLLRSYWSDSDSRASANTRQQSDVVNHLPPTIGRFQIRRQLGEGGYGVVFQAFDPQLGRDVALKIPRADVLVSADLRHRFQIEARTAASLDHPNIVPVFEAGEIGAICYIASAWCSGPNLAEWIKQFGPTSDRTSATIVAALADAMQHAHSRGVLHRDLKPANILMACQVPVADLSTEDGTADGTPRRYSDGRGDQPSTPIIPSEVPQGGATQAELTPRITDFGLAKLLGDADHSRTHTGTIVGTPNYMAPEQAAGRTREVSTASDIYALGTILYELLAGQPPFRADTTLELLRKIESEEPRPPSQLRAGIQRDIETICLKCLHKEPGRRYDSAASLLADLRRFLSGEPVLARPVTSFERLRLWCRRQPVIAGLSGVVMALIVSIAIAGPIAASMFRQQRDNEIKLKNIANNAKTAESIALQNAQDRLWDSQLAQAKAGHWSNRPGRRFDSLRTLAEAARARPALELRNEAVACLALLDVRPVPDWKPRHVLAFDADFERTARRESDGTIVIERAADQYELVRLPSPGGRPDHQIAAQFSPDGTHLWVSYGNGSYCFVWNLATRKRVFNYKTSRSTSGFDFSSDGKLLAFIEDQESIRVVDLETRKTVAQWKPRGIPQYVAFQPGQSRLAVLYSKVQEVDILDATSGKLERTIKPPIYPVAVAWHPDGNLLAITNNTSHRILVWNIPRDKPHTELIGHQNESVECRFSHDGDFILSHSWDQTIRIWDTMTGTPLLTFPGYFSQLRRDDRQLAYHVGDRGETRLLEIAPGRECRLLTAVDGWGGGPWSVSFDPTGRWLAAAAEDGVRIWSTATRKPLALLPTRRSESALFHPVKPYLVTHGYEGIHRWPIHRLPSGTTRIGPPESLHGPTTYHHTTLSLSRDGRWLGAVVGPEKAVVIDLEDTAKSVTLDGTPSLSHVPLSRDGQWAATCPQHGTLIRIWNARTGQVARDFVSGVYGEASFSPDDQSLVTHSQGYPRQTWSIGSWKEVPYQLHHGGGTFSPRGDLLALKLDGGQFQLIAVNKQTELATLTPAIPMLVGHGTFSPDGSLFAVPCYSTQSIQLWDLRSIATQLTDVNLPWDHPPFANPGDTKPVTSSTIEVVNGPLGN